MAQDNERLRRWWNRLRRGLLGILRILAGVATRSVLTVVAVLLLGWLAYVFVWRPLDRTLLLPPEIPQRRPALQADVLQRIVAGRMARVQHRLRPYSEADRVFVVPSLQAPADAQQ